MAKILLGAFLTDIRNKQQGTVFSRNRYGAYTRNNAVPTNPQTSRQAYVRSTFASLSSKWRTISDGDRQSWINGSGNFPSVDVFGNKRTLSGNALYMELNGNLLNNGVGASIDVCPAPENTTLFALNSVVADASAHTVVLSADTQDLSANDIFVVYAAPLLSAGRYYAKNALRQIFIGTTPVPGVATIAVGTEYEAAFGALVSGQRLVVSLRTINTVTGQSSVPQIVDTIVVP